MERHRVSVHSDARMVTLQAKVVPADPEPKTLYGWVYPPISSVLFVILDDGRELLISKKDVRATDDSAPDTERSPQAAL